MTTVVYTHRAPLVRRRPVADVELLGGANPVFAALVDTGADHLQIPLQRALAAGIVPTRGVATPVWTAGGVLTMPLVPNVPVRVEGKPVRVPVLVDHVPGARVILGRQALLAAVEAGFNVHEWLWRY